MKRIEVPVIFYGTVGVCVDGNLSDEHAHLLAGKLALARILATTENPDCAECLDVACEEFDQASEDDEGDS